MKKSLFSVAMTTCLLSLLPLSLYAAVPVSSDPTIDVSGTGDVSTPQSAPMPVTTQSAPVTASSAVNSSNMYAFLEGGYDFMSSPDSLSYIIPSGLASESYSTNKKNFSMVGVGMGYQFPVSYWPNVIQSNAIELGINYLPSKQFNGVRTDDSVPSAGSPLTSNYNYKLGMLRGMVNYIFNFTSFASFSPFASVGVGLENYKFSNFSETGISDDSFPYVTTDSVANKSSMNFAYSAGLGINYQPISSLGISLGYRFIGAGTAKSGDITEYNDATVVTTVSGFSQSLNANEVYLRLSYYFV
jgi:opacity protein-like surface antigen